MRLTYRSVLDEVVAGLCFLATSLSAGILFILIGFLFVGALPALTLNFILLPESALKVFDGAIGNAIAGTILISTFATLIATPFALGTSIYLAKYAPKNRSTETIRFFIEVLSGTPSIVVGVFAFGLLVVYLKPFTGGYSLVAGAIGLALLIMPVIERGTEEAILSISKELEEGSYALGANKWQTIHLVTIPAAISGIITGTILGFGRAAEESAVVLFTAGYSQFMPEFAIKANHNMFLGIKIYPLQDLVGTLPISVYQAYEHANIVNPANGFAAAFVLIAIVLGINLAAKAVCSGMIADAQGRSTKSRWLSFTSLTDPFTRKTPSGNSIGSASDESVHPTPSDIISEHQNLQNPATTTSAAHENLIGIINRSPFPGQAGEFSHTNPGPEITGEKTRPGNGSEIPKNPFRFIIRILAPFAIPAVLLLLIALLAGMPPLHHILGPASPFLAGVFATGLSLIMIVAGLAFALLLAKKTGAFRKKNRRTGFAAVAAGACLVCITGIVCASAASGVFSTGAAGSATITNADREAKLAALLAAGDSGSSQPSTGQDAGTQQSSVQAPSYAASAPGNASAVIIPRKNALSVGESYWWGDTQHTCRATIYDYKVLPFYFWWWIDYNRFVQQVPAAGDSYLVIFIHIENVGSQSAVVPSANAFNVSWQGNSTGRIPYLNRSLLSDNQLNELGVGSSEALHEQYYQWIREIGQNKRDYAYLTGENLFGAWNSTFRSNTTINNQTVSPSGSSSDYTGAYLKPGPSQAIDGYLIFEVPDKTAKDLNDTYVDVAFNSLSNARWKLGR